MAIEPIIFLIITSVLYGGISNTKPPKKPDPTPIVVQKIGYDKKYNDYIIGFQDLKPTPKTVLLKHIKSYNLASDPCLDNRVKVHFGIRKYHLTKNNKRVIDSFIGKAIYCGAKSIDIYGHASPVGMTIFNQKIAKKRALSVKKYLDQRKVSVSYKVKLDPKKVISDQSSELVFHK